MRIISISRQSTVGILSYVSSRTMGLGWLVTSKRQRIAKSRVPHTGTNFLSREEWRANYKPTGRNSHGDRLRALTTSHLIILWDMKIVFQQGLE